MTINVLLLLYIVFLCILYYLIKNNYNINYKEIIIENIILIFLIGTIEGIFVAISDQAGSNCLQTALACKEGFTWRWWDGCEDEDIGKWRRTPKWRNC